MKSLAVFASILLFAASAHAGLMISVNGVIEPPLGEVVLQPDETAVIGIHGDGLTPAPVAVYLFVEGPGWLDGYTMVYAGSLSVYGDFPVNGLVEPPTSREEVLDLFEEYYGLSDLKDLSFICLADGVIPPAALDGLVVDDIILRCDGLGDVTLNLVSDDFTIVYDTQIIQQIPEPTTLLLLGVGGLLAVARRRRKQQT